MSMRLLGFFSSLRLTIVLLALSMMLVFMATLAQTQLGIWEVMDRYIRTFVVWVPVGDRNAPVFPGGWLLGGLLLANLIAAHASRFTWTWKKAPIVTIHAGLVMLLISELITGLFARETQMTLDEGVERSYSEKPRHAELVIVDSSSPEHDRVWSIAEGSLASGKLIEHSALPFRLKVQKFYQNSQVFLRAPFVTGGASLANRGIGTGMSLREQPPVVTTDGRNTVSAEVELIGENGSLGTWLVSMAIDEPQRFAYSGRSYWIAMRPERVYRPYSMQLIKFTHQRHPGTEVPSQFASRVRLNNPQRNEDREVFISMNQPLRYAGETFYQASFANDDRTSILQVVHNPGWLLPYIACAMVGAGLVWQFVSHLARSTRRKDAQHGCRDTKGDGRRNRNRHPRGCMVDFRALALYPERCTGSRCVRASASVGRRQTQMLRHARPRCAADDVWKTDFDDTAGRATDRNALVARCPGATGDGRYLSRIDRASSRLAHAAWPAAGAKASPVV